MQAIQLSVEKTPDPQVLPDQARSGLNSSNFGVATIEQIRSICLNRIRILLVDDSVDNQQLYQRIFVAAGAHVELADNGEEAVARQAEADYDVIVMDIRMPILDGYQATRQIRNRGFRGPIIALTAHHIQGEEERCRVAGCSDFYVKPIDRYSLLKAVEQAFQKMALSCENK